MNSPGTTVYVHWYGKLLQGTVVNDHDLMGMVAVRIPLMGGHPVALFTPAHVYNSPEEPQPKPAAAVSAASPAGKSPDHSQPFPAPSTKDNPSYACQILQKFKQEHWDQQHNHILTAHLEDFYQLWRTAVPPSKAPPPPPAEAPTVSVDPGSSDGDRSSITITDVTTDTIVPYAAVSQQPQPLIKTHDQVVPVKLTKKQLRSTARIQYTDSIQTSIFD